MAQNDVETTHPDYDDVDNYWQLVRDALAGSRAIKNELPDVGDVVGNLVYLPRLTSQTEADYREYQTRATWSGFTHRALTAWTGLLFRKPVAVMNDETETEVEDNELLSNDVDLEGRSFQKYVEKVGTDVMSVGRAGTLIDFDKREKRPYFAFYPAENIINWRMGRIGGRFLLTLLVLKETSEAPDDQFGHQEVERWRVWERMAGATDGEGEGDDTVTVTVYERIDDQIAVVDSTFPTRRGRPLNEIPFVFHAAADTGAEIGNIPLLGIAELNVSHYRSSADLENGRHIAGIPTPWASGFTDSTTKEIQLGAKSALVTDDTGAKAGYLEFTGSGLSELRLALEEKEQQMAKLGARAITPESTSGPEATETVAMRATAESASLADVATALESQFTRAIQWFFWWTGTEDVPRSGTSEASTVFSRDFITSKMEPEQLQALTAALIAGKISFDAYYHNLKEGEFYPDGWTMEEERKQIEASQAMNIPTPAGPTPPGTE